MKGWRFRVREGSLHKDRMELIKKMRKLCDFIRSSDFSRLDPREQALIKSQRDAMETYAIVLERRLS